MKTILIIGAGQGLSQAVAEKFASEGFAVSLVSRNPENLHKLGLELKEKGIHITSASADAGDPIRLSKALESIQPLSGFDVVLYNAAVVKAKDILEETAETITKDFMVNTAGALNALLSTYNGLKNNKGAFLITGGGLAVHPNYEYGSLSIGKASLLSLAFQLHDRLKQDDIYVGILTVAGFINPESSTHSPKLLVQLFWNLYEQRSEIEFHQ